MPGTFLNYPFDEELFLMNWQAAADPTRTAMVESGAIQRNREIERLIASGSNAYSIPFYNVLGGTADNYDGTSNINVTAPTGGAQTGVVYGRAHAWKDQDFVRDFGNGANPMIQISQQVAKYWQKNRQTRLLGMLKALFDITDDNTDNWDAWQLHTLNLALAASGTVTDANRISDASAADAMQKAVGDNAGIFSMAFMHSSIANRLAKLQLLSYRKYTDPMGIERQLPIADWNGLTVIVDDGAPKGTSSTTSETEYTTYLLGAGAIQFGNAPVDTPVEIGRDRLAGGGYNYLVTRFRETYHPNGFSFTIPTSGSAKVISPTDAQLGTAGNWSLAGIDAKNIAIARIITNG